jgi:hypothetical protein
MNLYLLEQDTNTGYDTYDSAIVAAPNDFAAKRVSLRPDYYEWSSTHNSWMFLYASGPEPEDMDSWALPSAITATYIGKAAEGIKEGLVLASFNAG